MDDFSNKSGGELYDGAWTLITSVFKFSAEESMQALGLTQERITKNPEVFLQPDVQERVDTISEVAYALVELYGAAAMGKGKCAASTHGVHSPRDVILTGDITALTQLRDNLNRKLALL